MKRWALVILITLGYALGAFGSSQQLFSNEESELLEVFNRAENTIRKEGNYSRALDMYLTFIQGAENNEKFEKELLTAYVSVAVIYGSFNDIDNAIAYNKQAYRYARKLGNKEFAELALTNLAQSYKHKRNFKMAMATADSLLAFTQGKTPTAIFHYSIIKGETAHLMKRYSEALRCYRRADSAARINRLSSYERSAPLSLIAEYYGEINNPDSQLVYLDKAWSLIKDIRDPEPKAQAARSLMIYHTRHGNMAEAKKFQDIYFGLTDSLFNPEQFHNVSARHQEQRIAAKGNEIKMLNREVFRHRLIIAVIAGLLLLSLIFLWYIIRQKKSLKAAYQALFEKYRRLMALHDEAKAAPKYTCQAEDCIDDSDPKEERHRELFDRILLLMETSADYLNPDYGLSNLVVEAGSNAAYVSKVVKRFSGQSVPMFINEYRIREACRRLLDDENYGNITFSAIGESVGFSSQVSFNRTFKKVTGITPSLYRKMAEEERRKKE